MTNPFRSVPRPSPGFWWAVAALTAAYIALLGPFACSAKAAEPVSTPLTWSNAPPAPWVLPDHAEVNTVARAIAEGAVQAPVLGGREPSHLAPQCRALLRWPYPAASVTAADVAWFRSQVGPWERSIGSVPGLQESYGTLEDLREALWDRVSTDAYAIQYHERGQPRAGNQNDGWRKIGDRLRGPVGAEGRSWRDKGNDEQDNARLGWWRLLYRGLPTVGQYIEIMAHHVGDGRWRADNSPAAAANCQACAEQPTLPGCDGPPPPPPPPPEPTCIPWQTSPWLEQCGKLAAKNKLTLLGVELCQWCEPRGKEGTQLGRLRAEVCEPLVCDEPLPPLPPPPSPPPPPKPPLETCIRCDIGPLAFGIPSTGATPVVQVECRWSECPPEPEP